MSFRDDFLLLHRPNQDWLEWKKFIEFIGLHLRNQGVIIPVVLEIGVHTGYQQNYYRRFWNADWIGIDIIDKHAKPTILGDSTTPETVAEVERILNGRPIDVLFIDADHTYAAARKEYETYGPMTRHVIAFHDILCIGEIGRLFEDIREEKRGDDNFLFVTMGAWTTKDYQTGIGLIIKERNA